MLFVLWILNFVISWFNAWSVGKTWTETKADGGWPHFLSWCGATMAAVGFTWCYAVVLCFGATQIPITGDDGVSAPLLTMEQGRVMFDLAYLIIILPLLGSGFAILTHSWGVFWRERSLGNGVVAGWNTYAQISNLYSAFEYAPSAWDNVAGFFSGNSSDSDDAKGWIIIALVGVAVLGGVMTASMIIRSTARATAFSRRLRYESMGE